MKTRIVIAVVILLAIIITGVIVSRRSKPKSPPVKTQVTSLSLTMPGRQIEASLDVAASADTSSEGPVIVFGNHRLRIETDRLVLDKSRNPAPIAATARRIDVRLSSGVLTVSADSVQVLTARMGR